jgi:ABC-type multidrug transport system fused ATPase/permease subunit
LATSALKGVFLVLSVILVSRVSNRTVWDIRRIYFRKALELDQRRIDQIGTSNLMTQLAHNMQMISSGLGMFYGKMLREPLKMIVCLAGAAMISWKLLMISLIVIPFGAYLVQSISRRMKHASQKEIAGMSEVYQTLIETFGAIKTVRIFNRELTERVRFKTYSGALYRMSQRISLYDSILRPVGEMLGIISISLATLAGAYLVLNRETHLFGIEICKRPLSPSSLMMFYALLAGASDPARKMGEILNVLVRGGVACESLFKMFDQPAAEAI